MLFLDYVEYRCINLAKAAKRANISKAKITYRTCPNNLTEEQRESLKSIIGDWETFEPKGSNEEQEQKE